METEDLVEVYRAKSSVQAHLMVSELEDAGIKAMVDGDELQGGLGGEALGWSAAPRVLVAASNEGAPEGFLNILSTESRRSDVARIVCRGDFGGDF